MSEMMKIDERDYRKEYVKEIQKNLKANPENKLFVWGCAQTAAMITNFIKQNSDLEISAYIVDDLYYKEGDFCGKPIQMASQWKRECMPGDYVVMGFVGAKRAQKVIEKLPKDVKGIYFYFPYSANIDGTYLDYDTYSREKEKYEEAYEMLEDELSKKTMEAFINGCASGNVEALDKLTVPGQYFNQLTKNWKTECFVDCGAYIGDTIEACVEFFGQELKKIVAFEPDEKNIRLLKEKVEECGIKSEQLVLVTKGSWSKEETLRFSSSNSSSNISENGDIEIKVDSIDHILDKVSEKVSFIKLDVEGSEKESLLGAKEIIKRDYPLIAVCVYHKAEDLYVLLKLIQQLAGEKEYKYYFRYHGPDLRELVLYAVPV